jgi:hypothetical protein
MFTNHEIPVLNNAVSEWVLDRVAWSGNLLLSGCRRLVALITDEEILKWTSAGW